ncbi:hypothetical protein GCM10027294_07260 [Marinactinospora endophytica]
MAETPIQHFRAAQDLWDAGLARAAREGRSLPSVLRTLLRAYGDGTLVVDEGRITIIQPHQLEQAKRKAEGDG